MTDDHHHTPSPTNNVAGPDADRVADPVAEQLVNQAQLIARLRRDLDEFTHEATDIVADLLARIDDLEAEAQNSTGPRAGRPAAWCWRTLGPHGTQELWAQLTAWVDWLRARYPLARRIPDCWSQHPEIVEELTALWLAWTAAYETTDPPLTAAADWHDRWLPGLLHRLEHGPFALDCTNGHHARPATAYANPEQ